MIASFKSSPEVIETYAPPQFQTVISLDENGESEFTFSSFLSLYESKFTVFPLELRIFLLIQQSFDSAFKPPYKWTRTLNKWCECMMCYIKETYSAYLHARKLEEAQIEVQQMLKDKLLVGKYAEDLFSPPLSPASSASHMMPLQLSTPIFISPPPPQKAPSPKNQKNQREKRGKREIKKPKRLY